MAESVSVPGEHPPVQYHCKGCAPVSDVVFDGAAQVWIGLTPLAMDDLPWLTPLLDRLPLTNTSVKVCVGTLGGRTEPAALRWLAARLAVHPEMEFLLCDPECTSTPSGLLHSLGVVVVTGMQSSSGIERHVWSSAADGTVSHCGWQDQVSAGVELELLEQRPWTVPATEIQFRKYERKYDWWLRVGAADAEGQKSVSTVVPPEYRQSFQAKVSNYLNNPDNQAEFQTRQKTYRQAKGILHQMLTSSYQTSEEFLADYGKLVGTADKIKVWKSGSIHRQKTIVAQRYDEFVALLREIRDHVGEPPGKLFHRAMEAKRTRDISGLGVNVITEIMHTYRPDLYPVLNNNSLATVKHHEIAKVPGKQSFKADDYQTFSEVMVEIAIGFGFENLAHVDECLNLWYWEKEK